MTNSPTVCEKYVAQSIYPLLLISYPDLYVVHNMDDIFITGPDEDQLYIAGKKLEKSNNPIKMGFRAKQRILT